MHDEVMTLLQERYPELEHEEMHRRAEIIAMGAIRFFVLKYEASKDFVFDRKTSLSFDGES
jgi:arginyl-tRNA synthetase